MKKQRGLVIGKFYPPHAGHHYLISEAERQADQVVVLVCDRDGQEISGTLRARWLSEMHPNTDVRVIPDELPEDDSAAWAAFTREVLGYTPELVFTSEDYGDAYARHLGSRHVLVDKARNRYPVSGTAVRSDPYGNWEYLSAPVRAHFVRRIVVVGAESTGTTTLARDLAEHFNTVWVPEYGRLFSEAAATDPAFRWCSEDFVHIAKQQNEMEDVLARSANKVLICDTDSFATGLWHERYMGEWSDTVEQVARSRRRDLYILTGDEIPFVQDGLRDGEHIRHKMHQRFIDVLSSRNFPWVSVSGSRKQRKKQAILAIDGPE